jgi:hypothetical protein
MPDRALPAVVVDDDVVDVGFDDAAMLLEPEPHIPDNPDVSVIPEDIDSPDVAEMEVDVDMPEDADVPGVAMAPGVVVPLASPIPPPS